MSTTKLGKLRYRVRYAIAEVINRRPGQCWADLVMWAMGNAESKLPWASSASCREDMERTGCCYCGKFRSATSLRDRDGGIWSLDEQGTYTAFDGLFTGWRRKDVEAMYGPVIEQDGGA